MVKSLIVIITTCFVSFSVAGGLVSFSYEGMLTDSLGEPLEDSVYAIQFSIYEDSITTSPLWSSNGFIPRKTTDGRFYHKVGYLNPLPDSLSSYDSFWVGIAVDYDDEITRGIILKRVQFTLSELYAREAQEALAAIYAEAKIQYAETGILVTDINQIKNLQLIPSVAKNWTFTIISNAKRIEKLRATSTEQMPGGTGKIVELNPVWGNFSGYGSDGNK